MLTYLQSCTIAKLTNLSVTCMFGGGGGGDDGVVGLTLLRQKTYSNTLFLWKHKNISPFQKNLKIKALLLSLFMTNH